MAIIIRSIKDFKFALVGENKGREGYMHSTGLAFYDNESHEWIAGNDKNGSTGFPYVPVGGRKACQQILADSGDFFKLQPRVKSI